MVTVCRCPDMKFLIGGSVEPLRQGLDLSCPSCYPDANATWGQQCTAERPFGPCTKRCEKPAGHEGQHRAQCFTWCCDQHVPDACAPDEGVHQADDYPRPCCERCPNGKAA